MLLCSAYSLPAVVNFLISCPGLCSQATACLAKASMEQQLTCTLKASHWTLRMLCCTSTEVGRLGPLGSSAVAQAQCVSAAACVISGRRCGAGSQLSARGEGLKRRPVQLSMGAAAARPSLFNAH
jgi:hypothetical protein